MTKSRFYCFLAIVSLLLQLGIQVLFATKTHYSTDDNYTLNRKYSGESSNFKVGSISYFPISYSDLTISLNVGTPTTNIIEITYPVTSQDESSSPLLFTSIRPASNLVPNAGQPPAKSFVRNRKIFDSGLVVYQHVIRFYLLDYSSDTTSSSDMIIDMYTLQQTSFVVYVSVAPNITNQQVSYPSDLVDELFPGIYLYGAFVAFAILLVIGSILIWFLCYRTRENPAALGELETRFWKNCSILCVGLIFYFCTFLFAASGPIFAMNRSLTKCCANYQSVFEITPSTKLNVTSNGFLKVGQMRELDQCATLVSFQHLFWFGEQMDTEENLSRFQCFGDFSKTFTLYHYNFIIYVIIFCGFTICVFPCFHCLITVYANKIYMLTKEQHKGESTIKFTIVV